MTTPATDRRRRTLGAYCPECGEFVEERWAQVVEGRLVFLCWSGHRWVDRRRPTRPVDVDLVAEEPLSRLPWGGAPPARAARPPAVPPRADDEIPSKH